MMRAMIERMKDRGEMVFGLAMMLLVVGCAAWAQEPAAAAPAPTPGISGMVGGILVGMIPALLAAAKGMISKLPPRILPWLAVALGVLGDGIWAYSTGGTLSPGVGAALGLAAVGLRELYDQTKKAVTKGPASLFIPFLLAGTLAFAGVALANNGRGHGQGGDDSDSDSDPEKPCVALCEEQRNDCRDAARVECKTAFEECSIARDGCRDGCDTTTTTLPAP